MRIVCILSKLEYIPQCQYILEKSSTPYAQLLASSSLTKQVTEQNLTSQLRLDIRTYVANYLLGNGHELQPFVTGSLIQLLRFIEDDRSRNIVKGVVTLLIEIVSAPTHRLYHGGGERD